MITQQAPLTLALPKGRMAEKCATFLAASGLSVPTTDDDRLLIIENESGTVRHIMTKPTDVPTLVEYGAADMGICGLDTLRESGGNVFEPLLLPYEYCRLSVCGVANQPHPQLRYMSQPRVATKYTNLASQFFQERGINAEIIKLHGSVELGPLVGLADLIVDIVSTGTTLRVNGLVEIRTIMESQAVVIANPASYRLKSTLIQDALDRMRQALKTIDAEKAAVSRGKL
ncbi:MAG: ATP phosphoribosyltransferase [Chloroflexota bacterium]